MSFRRLGPMFKLAKQYPIISGIIIIGLVLHTFCMLIYPWIHYDFDWDHVHAVWDHWQTLNGAVIALLAALIGFYITMYHDLQEQRRSFEAEKAFLADTLSKFSSYYQSVISVTWAAYKKGIEEDNPLQEIGDETKEGVEIFKGCIKYAGIEHSELKDYLITILAQPLLSG